MVDAVPHGHWKTTTFVVALRLSGLFAAMVVDGALNGELFVKYVRQELVPRVRAMTRNHLKVRQLLARLSEANWRLLQMPPDD